MVDVAIHNTTANPPQATTGGAESTSWLSIRQGESEISIFGRIDQIEAFRMVADVFNDAFQIKAEPPPAPQGPPTLEDSDIPW